MWLPLVAATSAVCLASSVSAQAKSAARTPAEKSTGSAVKTAAQKAGSTGSRFVVSIQYDKHGKGGTAKFWVKGNKIREEKKTGGGLRVIMISNEDGVFLKNKYSNVWAKLPPSAAAGLVDRLLGGPSGDPQEFLRQRGAKKVGTEKYDGEPCVVWKYQSARNVEQYKLLVSKKTGKPVRLERNALLGGKFREKIFITYTNFAWNVPIPEALFKVPANEQVREMNRSLLRQPTEGNKPEDGKPEEKK
jgi:outer membrane lipoprotein-sorting protein